MRSPPSTVNRARALRGVMTPPELALWARLRVRDPARPAFRRQHPLGPYVLDFYCAAAKLVIEVDGQAHDHGDRPARDEVRDAFLVRQGLRVMRYRADEVMGDPNGVADAICSAAAALAARRIAERPRD